MGLLSVVPRPKLVCFYFYERVFPFNVSSLVSFKLHCTKKYKIKKDGVRPEIEGLQKKEKKERGIKRSLEGHSYRRGVGIHNNGIVGMFGGYFFRGWCLRHCKPR